VRVLLLDVGNTRLKWGVGEAGEVRQTGHVVQARLAEVGLGALTRRLPRRVDAAIACNVAGQSVATRLQGVIHAHTGHDLHFARPARAACGVTNGYTRPRRLGVDRWVALVGAWAELERACLVVDAGTAVTIDALDGGGRHLGGQILPGINVMADALAGNTAQIPRVAMSRAGDVDGLGMFGNSTRAAVQQGTLNAVTGAIERALKTLRRQYRRAQLVLTGGDASRIVGALDATPLERPHLVLQGLLELHDAGHRHDR
jgi:type III pantothenate kinase